MNVLNKKLTDVKNMKLNFIMPPLRWIILFCGLYSSVKTGAQNQPLAPGVWSIVASYTIPGKASGLAWDGSYIYFGIYGSNGQNIYKFDPASGSNSLQCAGPFADAYGLTFKGPTLVTINQPSNSSQPATTLEFSMSGTQVSTITLPDHYMSGVAWDNGSYWVCTYYPDPGKVYHINSSGTVLSQFVPPNNQPWDICLQGSDLWIADYYGNMLYKVSSTGTLIESHASQIGKPAGVVYDGTYLWYCAGELGANSTLYKVDLQGSGTPAITVPVTSHNYGTVTAGSSSTWNCQVQNTGSANLVLTSLGVSPGIPVTTSMSFPATITPGGSVNMPVTYSPLSPGALNTAVYINSNDPVHPSVAVNLTGNAVISGPHINITDTVHDYGDRRKRAYSGWYLQINNNGSSDLVISGLATSDSAFKIDQSVTLPVTVAPLQTVKIRVWFHPYEAQTFDGTLDITSNDPLQNPFHVHLSGNGIYQRWPMGEPLWSYFITGSFDTSPKGIEPIGDITGDGIDDVVVASEDYYIRCFNGNASVTGDVLWETMITSGNVYQQNAITKIEDIDNDGIGDVVIGTTGGDRSVRALSGKTGTPLWRYDTHAFGGGGWVYQVDARLDYNNDGKPDVLACAGDDGNNTGPKRVFCLNGLTGQPIWICPTEGAVFSVTGVDDFNGDGKPDVVAGATNAAQTQSRVYGINGASGNILWTNIPFGSSTWALLQVDDYNGDGIRDVASGDYSGNVYFHNAVTGNRDKTTLIQSMALVLRFEDIGDVNKDGHPDFIVGHSAAKAVVINGRDASILWQTPLADKSWNVTGMGDISWDGVNDVAAGTLYVDNRTYFLNGANGAELYSATGNTPVDALDAIPDIAGDNSMELMVGGRNGGLVCLSGGYDSTQTAINPNTGIPEDHVTIFPNPAYDILNVVIRGGKVSEMTMDILDMNGRVVCKNVGMSQKDGIFTIPLKSENLSAVRRNPGLYLLRISTGNQITYQKVALIIR